MKESDATDEAVKELNDKGITVVTVPDDDKDHSSGRKKADS
jgi:ABC-type sugar transport system substrate-binding protein